MRQTVAEIDETSSGANHRPSALSHRDAGDDFICLRYQVWYPSLDCAIRTRYRTCAGCLNCEQGLFNLKRHSDAVSRMRFVLPDSD